jgi:hypothetical protein
VAADGVRGDSSAEMSVPTTFGSGVAGVNTSTGPAAGPGVYGESRGTGVWGSSHTWTGVFGISRSTTGGAGVWGQGEANGAGVVGLSAAGVGVVARTKSTTGAAALQAEQEGSGPGVLGLALQWHGVYGRTASTTGGAGVMGEHTGNGPGMLAQSAQGIGLLARSEGGEAVRAETNSSGVAAIAAVNRNAASGAAAVYAEKAGTAGHAGYFAGRVMVTTHLEVGGDISLVNADFAEEFDLSEPAEPGTVVVLNEDGSVRPAKQAYDGRVAGIICGAGSDRPGIILDRRPTGRPRSPVALVGKVYCRVDARERPLAVGDLLTTSALRGHAMKADDPARAFGAVLGKALQPLTGCVGLIRVLVALR